MTREQRLSKRQRRRRARERRQEAPADLKRQGNAKRPEDEQRRRQRLGAQQLRHDRRRRRGQANRDPGARRGSTWGGFWPAGGERRR